MGCGKDVSLQHHNEQEIEEIKRRNKQNGIEANGCAEHDNEEEEFVAITCCRRVLPMCQQ